MYLKSLVLKGFKSFADRSVMTLEPGITAVVGPNGSGKSNISDAVLWVLGERNAKHLRGQAMEDVIFAGSSARKQVSVAEVDLVLDNVDGTLPVDYDEVAITRRMYRSGESEYLINGVVARRMDVLDILHDSGLGTGTHSIISQGSLDSILQSKPEDRRALIEEAAGVLKHKQRKAKSERKLEQMEQHVTRARDVVNEVQRQLGPLERKAKRALAYQGLSAELADLSLRLAVDDLRTLQAKWTEAGARESSLEEQLEQKRAVIAEAEARVAELQEKIRLESVDAGELARRHREAAAAVERIDSASLVMRERRRSAQARVVELEIALEANAAKKVAAEGDLRSVEGQLVEVRAQRASADELVESLASRFAALSEKREGLEREAAVLGRLSREWEAKADTARRKLAETQEALTNGLAHVKLIEGHSKELQLQLERAQADARALADQTASCDEELNRAAAIESEARARVGAALRERDEARAAAEAARDAVLQTASQIKGLEEVERAAAAAEGPALAWVMEHAAELEADLAPLSHVVSAPRGRELLVERLLGADVAALLVADSPRALQVAQAMAAEAGDGVVSLLLREDAGGVRGQRPRALDYRGDEGFALVSELSYPASAADAVEALLGDVVVCDTLEQALRAHEADTLGLRFAAPDGVVWPSGKVLAGAPAQSGESVLARVRRLEELRVSLADAERKHAAAQHASDASEEALRAAQALSLDASQTLAQLRGRAEAARAEAARSEEKLASVRRELEDVERQRADAQAVIAKARPDVEGLERQVQECTRSWEDAKAKRTEALRAVTPLREEAQQVQERLSEAKLSAATLAERETYSVRVRDARVREMEQLQASEAESRAALARKTASARRMEPLLALFEELALSARRWTRSLEDQATAAQDSSTGLHAAAQEARASAHAAHEAYDQVNERLAQARVDKGRLEVQVESAVSAIEHDCASTLEAALALPALEDRAEAEEAAGKLRRRIANMGTINPDAAAEYEALKKRYDYLASQLADLDGARRALAKINRAIDARMKEDFVRTYEQVDRNFQEIFATLFPGGSAHLALVDPDDLENTGVEVSAQPAGKRITKMMLMSGGEKSLTALALLFAVYRIRTTPFYILDEVEAALDDTNLRRLTAYIDQLRDTTQLIMITHQRRTMEMADVLFGVSMQADGVTKVVSQKLDRALQYAD